MNKSIAAGFAGALLMALPAAGQTAVELLQKGIYVQETEGNLDNAILIYRQIVNSAPAQREVAAQAQYRLAQALLQKGDLATASKEFERLARDYADYQKLISNLAAQASSTRLYSITGPGGRGGGGGRGVPEGRGGPGAPLDPEALQKIQDEVKKLELARRAQEQAVLAQSQALLAMEFDNGTPINITGKLTRVVWTNPRAWITVETGSEEDKVMLHAPNYLVTHGVRPTSLRPGEEVTVTGVLAKDGSRTVRADKIIQDGKVIFDRASLPAAQ
jgi:tetratricopeptide (TPR) repeat protein